MVYVEGSTDDTDTTSVMETYSFCLRLPLMYLKPGQRALWIEKGTWLKHNGIVPKNVCAPPQAECQGQREYVARGDVCGSGDVGPDPSHSGAVGV